MRRPAGARACRATAGVWVFIEQTEGEAAKVSWELLGKGTRTGRSLGVELCAVVIGEKVEHLCHEAFAYGADKAYLIDAPVFRYYRTEAYLKAVCSPDRKVQAGNHPHGGDRPGPRPGRSGRHGRQAPASPPTAPVSPSMTSET